jgi:hypothetical protein
MADEKKENEKEGKKYDGGAIPKLTAAAKKEVEKQQDEDKSE